LRAVPRHEAVSLRAGLAVAAAILIVAAFPLASLAHQTVTFALWAVVLGAGFAGVGFVIVRSQPRNLVGWVFLAAGLSFAVTSDASSYAVMRYRLHEQLPLGPPALFLGALDVAPFALVPLALLFFPDGTLPARRWRLLLWVYVGLLALDLVARAVPTYRAVAEHLARVDGNGTLEGASRLTPSLLGPVDHALGLFALLVGFAWTASQAVAYRRLETERREQLKWLLGGTVAFLLLLVMVILLSSLDGHPSFVVNLLSFLAQLAVIVLPVSVGVAILRYRLFDIDRLISRTLSYAVLTVLLAGVFVGIVVLATDVLPFSSPVAVAASTLAAAALFNPLRLRTQRTVDRRFNRAHYDAEATVAAFAGRLREALEIEGVAGELLRAVDETVAPAHADLWVKPGRKPA
jgi:hypothetical protein